MIIKQLVRGESYREMDTTLKFCGRIPPDVKKYSNYHEKPPNNPSSEGHWPHSEQKVCSSPKLCLGLGRAGRWPVDDLHYGAAPSTSSCGGPLLPKQRLVKWLIRMDRDCRQGELWASGLSGRGRSPSNGSHVPSGAAQSKTSWLQRYSEDLRTQCGISSSVPFLESPRQGDIHSGSTLSHSFIPVSNATVAQLEKATVRDRQQVSAGKNAKDLEMDTASTCLRVQCHKTEGFKVKKYVAGKAGWQKHELRKDPSAGGA